MVKLVKTLGTPAAGAAGPQIFAMTPPPLMATNAGFPTMQTTINTLLPKLYPLIAKANTVRGAALPTIDMFKAFGGVVDWPAKFPKACAIGSPWPPCKWWCDKQNCGPCHPDDNGYTHMAQVVYQGLGFK